ncbi:MAG: hypothetical protein CMJ31_01315 [Phycisphaerae bacterium]|nr:hypothetical protein [Phycisphaerae bacterium]
MNSCGARTDCDVVIAGGGIAGIAAALHLADHGKRVILCEATRRLGGRATSLVDQRSGEEIDNCQHVALGCCTTYLAMLARLDSTRHLRWDREQTWIEAGGRRSTLRPSALPAPFHQTPAFLGASFLSPIEKLAIGRCMAAIARSNVDRWRRATFGDFLDRHHQPEGARRRFWDPIVISACNLVPSRVAASSALKVFKEGFLASPRAAEIGVSRVPLASLYDAVGPELTALKGHVALGARAARIDERRVELASGEVIRAGAVICALPPTQAARLVSDERSADIAAIGTSPIIGVHLRFDRPVIDVPHAVLVDRPTQWLFRKDEAGESVHAVISAADEWVDLDEDSIVERVRDDMSACLPASVDAQLSHARAIKEKRATFAATPEVERRRPTQAPERAGGIVLAGDYTQTGWPATMEGAARSGAYAAEVVLGLPRGELIAPELAPTGFSRWLDPNS